MRLLAIDVGTGTQDILLWESGVAVENLVQMVMPSPTVLVERRVRAATRAGQAIFLDGVTMGGGPCAWAIMDHLRAGLAVYATPAAARTLDDDLERVAADGVRVVDSSDAAPADAITITLGDLDLAAIGAALRAFDVNERVDGLLVAAFDHGAAPPGYSDRTFRFDYLARTIGAKGDLAALAYMRDTLPPDLTRLAAIAACVPGDLPLLLMDTGAAAALGALDDPLVGGAETALLVNAGNFHTLAFTLRRNGTAPRPEVLGLFEHHTGELQPAQLDGFLDRLAGGQLTNAEIFDSMGHGALLRSSEAVRPDLYAVTGPRRALLGRSHWSSYFAVPHGDMMLAGAFGLLRAAAVHVPDWREEIDSSLA